MKISSKFTLYFAIVFLFVILITGLILGFFFYKTSKDQVLSYIFSSSRARAEHLITFLEEKKTTSSILAAASVYRDFLETSKNDSSYVSLKDKIDKRLQRTLEVDRSILEVYILDKNGKVVASSDKDEEGEDRSTDAYFVNAKEDTYIKDIYYYDDFGKNIYALSSPILDDDDNLLGVSVLLFSTDSLYQIIQTEDGIGKTEENFIVNSDKYFISPSLFLGGDVVLNQKVETDNVDACFSEKETNYIKQNKYLGLRNLLGEEAFIEAKDYRGVDIIGTHLYVPTTGWCFITKIDKAEIYWNIYQFILILVGIFIISILLFLFFSFWLVKIIIKPLSILTNITKKVQSGDYNIIIDDKSDDEVGDLAKNFETMIKSVKQSRKEVDLKVEQQTKEIVEKSQNIEGQQKAILNVLEDIETEKTKTEALLSGIGEGVIATDVNKNIIFINKSAEDMIGWNQGEVIGKNIYDVLLMSDENNKPITEENRPFYIALNAKKKVIAPLQSPYYYLRKNGEKFPVTVTVTPVILNEKIIGAIDVFRDITHEKEIDKAKTEFVSLASHQLRTPLSAINWYTEMLLDGDVGKITKEQKNYLSEVYRSNKRMIDLVNSLLNVSRIDLGTFAIVPELVDISEISRSVLMELTPMIKTKKMVIEEKYDKNVKKIKVDQKLIRIVFQNLLSNAVKYTPEKGKILVSIKKEKNHIAITVQDNGYGIPKDVQGRIFEKLFRADNIRSKDTDGTGLGLYIVKSILEQSGGSIKFESEENKGTTFYVKLPLSGMKSKSGNKDLS